MQKKNTAIVIMMAMLILLPSAFAVKPTNTFVQSNTGIAIAAPIFDYMKANNSLTFNYHLYNSTNGLPIISGVSCTFHLYDQQGSHKYELDPITTFDDKYDIEIKVAAGNFTKGFYDSILQCNTSNALGSGIGGFTKDEFELTYSGFEPASDLFRIFMILAAISAIIASIYFFVELMQKFPTLSITALDFAKNLIVFICILFLYGMNLTYFGDIMIENIFKMMLIFGALGNVAASAFVTTISYVRKVFQMRKWGAL